ncbi:MAG: Na+:solute symporter [Chitinophagaceae bacterium]|nr:Na+:solute symporter [Chitinophagaceae bacterium]MBK9379804.1 Na+:solute symporter [Chitinophagaceae bacterium]MBL0304579.1 Na+:solute symporter [Chitinophagaceae bacterium]HQV60927.1 Na+:solute symporter [Chitinophagaceae bacterium]HQV84771.1 Na+:solute symporter [Chitinophagaceae bacterium]
MKLQLLDILIVITYLATMVFIGVYMRKKARENKESYLMGGKKLPWYMLGLSDASDMFDISGTMWMVALCFVYGMKSMWIPWLWPVFNQVFMMMFLSKWLRRSNANTGAEWLATRFGLSGKGVKGSHNVVVIFALIGCFGFLAYGFIGLGKFIEIFVPWEMVSGYIPFNIAPQYAAHFYGIVFTLFAMFYSIIGGLHSIVLGDFIKYIIMTVACVSIAVIAMIHLHQNGNQLRVPDGWLNPFFGWDLDLDWSGIVPDVNKKIEDDGYGLFGIFFMMMLFKGIFASLAGPAPNYDMQKVLSTRSPKEASKMTGFVSIILLPVRYSMVIGLTILALLYYNQLNLSAPGGGTDFEKILPAAVNNFLPVGVLGLVLTGLLGAFMGTFSGTLNAAQAYIVNDVYLKYINPDASNKKIIRTNYIVGVLVVAIGVVLGFFAKDVNSILQWIVGGLYGGYIAANLFKWYWWRFNANGFLWGMASGILGALVFLKIYDGLFLYIWPVLFIISIAGCLIGTYTAPPTEIDTLKSFYKSVRPWGFWKPVHRLVVEEDPSFQPNRRFKLDMFNVVLGVIAQCCLTILPMYIVLWMKLPLLITISILLVIVLILKRTWWDKLED